MKIDLKKLGNRQLLSLKLQIEKEVAMREEKGEMGFEEIQEMEELFSEE